MYLVLLGVVGISACYTSALQYLLLLVHCMPTVLHATQPCTLGITAPHNRTYPEYPWVVLCVVLCYAVGVLLCGTCCSVCSHVLHTLSTVSIIHVLLLGIHGYIEGLLHHPSHVACIHRGVEDTTHWTMAKEM